MLNRHPLRKVFVLISSFCLMIVQSSFAVLPVFDPLNAKLNLVTSLKTAVIAIQQLQQIYNQLQSIKFQAENLRRLSGQNWDNAYQALTQLGRVMQQGTALAYSASNIDRQFKQRFPGYAKEGAITDYPSEYKKWVQTNQDTMNGIMRQVHATYEQQQSHEKVLNQLLAQKAKSTQGRLQALQVGNEIAAEQIAQMQMLKATMMAQLNAQAEYYAYQAQKDAARQQSVDAVIKASSGAYKPYQNKSQFGLIPSFGNGG